MRIRYIGWRSHLEGLLRRKPKFAWEALVHSGSAGLVASGRSLWRLKRFLLSFFPFFKSEDFPVKIGVPVVSIGNIVFGGTGKSPLVRWVVRHFQGRGLKPGIVATGYGSKMGRKGRVLNSGLIWGGDEVEEHRKQLEGVPIAVGLDRGLMAKKLTESFPLDVVVVDDGFQHRRLHRDLDVVVIDATMPLHPLHPLLREPISGLVRADVLCLSRVDCATPPQVERMKETLSRWSHPQALWVEMGYQPVRLTQLATGEVISSEQLGGLRAVAVSAIASHDAFATLLHRLGVEIAVHLRFPDHHFFSTADLRSIEEEARWADARAIIVTEKEAVKLSGWCPVLPVYAIRVEVEIIHGEEGFRKRLDRVTDSD